MDKNKVITVDETFNLAVKNHQENKLEVAQDLYNQVLEIDPNYAKAYNNLGSTFENTSDYKKALSYYEKAIEIDPNYIRAHENLGGVLQILGQNQKAKERYEKAIKIDPNHSISHNNLGVVFKKLGENQKAKECFEKAIEVDPNYANAYHSLGSVLQILGQDQKAKESYEKAIEKDPNLVNSHNSLGKIFHDLEAYKKAKECYEKAIEIDPNCADAHNNLGVVFKKLGQDQKAINCYQKAIEINPNLSAAIYNAGEILRMTGYHEKAKDYLEKVIQIEPNHKDAHINLGIVFYEIGEYQKAIRCYKKAIEIDPNFEKAHHNLANVYEQINSQEKSVEHTRKALKSRSKINFDKFKDKELLPATNSFYLELTNKCNFHCEFCPSDSQTRLQGFMDLSLVKKIFDEIAEKKIVNVVALHLMGEPTLHPKLNEILAYAKSKKVKINLTTNGSTMVKKRVPMLLENMGGYIVASLMTPTEETYKIRGEVGLGWDRYVGNFRLLIQEHLKKILKDDRIDYEIVFRVMVTNKDEKGTAKVLGSSIGLQENYEEWSNFTATVEKELGLKPFNRQKIDSDKTFNMLGSGLREISFFLQKNIKIQFWRAFTFANTRVSDKYKLEPQKKAQFCSHPFKDFGVLWNGDVTLCCLDYDATLKVGNINSHSVEDVMNSKASKKLRASMYGLEKLHPTCVKCQARTVEK